MTGLTDGFMPGGCQCGGCGCTPPGLSLDEYQIGALVTNVTPDLSWDYHVLGVIGELAEHVKKARRDDDSELTDDRKAALVKELGDCLWYVAVMASEMGVSLERVAVTNLEKLAKRAAENKIKGSGDDR